MEIRKDWLRNRLSNVHVADDFNYALSLAQTKSSFNAFLTNFIFKT